MPYLWGVGRGAVMSTCMRTDRRDRQKARLVRLTGRGLAACLRWDVRMYLTGGGLGECKDRRLEVRGEDEVSGGAAHAFDTTGPESLGKQQLPRLPSRVGVQRGRACAVLSTCTTARYRS